MSRYIFHIIFVSGLLFLYNPGHVQAKKVEASANSLFVSAMRFHRKARKEKDLNVKLVYLKEMQQKLDRMIEDFPDDTMTLKLVMGELRGDWLDRVERLIGRVQKQIAQLGNVKFTKKEKACLDDMTAGCIKSLLRVSVNRVGLEKKEVLLSRSFSILEAIEKALKGEREPLLEMIRTGRRSPLKILGSLLRNGQQDMAVKLMIEAGRIRYNRKGYRIDSYARAMRNLDRITRGGISFCRTREQPKLHYGRQGRMCNRLRSNSVDYTRGSGKDNIWSRLHKARYAMMDDLCAVKNVSVSAQAYFDLYVKPEARGAKRRGKSSGVLPDLQGLVDTLVYFGHHEVALRMLHQIPKREIPRTANRKDKKKLHVQMYGGYLAELSMDVMMLKLAGQGKK